MNAIPDFFSICGLLKASASEEGGERFIYMEVSNEHVDAQGERVLTEALQATAGSFEKFGNIDIDHITLTGARAGIPDYLLYEVGRPIKVKIDGARTFVKAQLYQGDTPVATQANLVWDSLTKLNPPARWYPSVGGSVLEKSVEIDPKTQARISVVKRVRWTNVALSRTPVNQDVPCAAALPFGVFAKCWGAGGLDLTKAEGLVAGQNYDIQDADGGQALRAQSLDRKIQSYWAFRDQFADDIRNGICSINRKDASALLAKTGERYGLDSDRAAEYLERFFGDLDRRTMKRQTR
jgi:hypothetical protein